MTDSTAAPSLSEALATHKERMQHYKVSVEHLIPDIVLCNYSIDVHEQASATQLLATSPVPRTSYSNARVALEAAINMHILVAEPRAYDVHGSRARAAELLEQHDLASRCARADGAAFTPFAGAADCPEAIAHADADEWEAQSPGRGSVMRRAFADIKAANNQRKHWSGLSWKDMLGRVGSSIGNSSYSMSLDAFYGYSSVQTHSRPRTGQRNAIFDRSGCTLTISAREVDARLPTEIALVAVIMAIDALDRRNSFDGA